MSPSKNVINGARPSPLSINKGSSQVIRKQSFPNEGTRAKSGKSPIIIYAQSPKVIHTKPRDFMALVQKLTGLARSQEIEKSHGNLEEESIDLNQVKYSHEMEDEVSSPAVTTEMKNSSRLLSPSFPNQFFVDLPLFTPTSNNLFFSPRNL